MFAILLCSHAAFCINHYMVILFHLACFFAPPTTHLLLLLVTMFTHAYPHHVVTHALHSFSSSKSQWSVKVCTTFLVACIGYHGNNCKQTMMPNALWIRKDGLSGVLCQLIDTLVMHSITMPWCINHISSMIGCWSIGHHNFHSHKHGVGPNTIF